MQSIDVLIVADDTTASHRTGAAFSSPLGRALGSWNRLWRRLCNVAFACFAPTTSDPKSGSDSALGKYDPFLTLY